MASRKHSKPVPPIDSPDRRRLPPLLRRAWYGLNQAFRRHIAHTGATPDQFTAMRCLTEADPKGITQGELTQMMSSDPNTIASLVERMEAAGWVERRAHEKDRRAYRIRLKPSGKRLYLKLERRQFVALFGDYDTGFTVTELARYNPQRRLIAPVEVAAAVLWLCRRDSQSMTGPAIAVAGGEVM